MPATQSSCPEIHTPNHDWTLWVWGVSMYQQEEQISPKSVDKGGHCSEGEVTLATAQWKHGQQCQAPFCKTPASAAYHPSSWLSPWRILAFAVPVSSILNHFWRALLLFLETLAVLRVVTAGQEEISHQAAMRSPSSGKDLELCLPCRMVRSCTQWTE